MGRKAEERERRKERNKRVVEGLSCALDLALAADVFVFLVASLTGDTEVAVYAFLAVAIIVPPMTGCMLKNLGDGPSSWTFLRCARPLIPHLFRPLHHGLFKPWGDIALYYLAYRSIFNPFPFRNIITP